MHHNQTAMTAVRIGSINRSQLADFSKLPVICGGSPGRTGSAYALIRLSCCARLAALLLFSLCPWRGKGEIDKTTYSLVFRRTILQGRKSGSSRGRTRRTRFPLSPLTSMPAHATSVVWHLPSVYRPGRDLAQPRLNRNKDLLCHPLDVHTSSHALIIGQSAITLLRPPIVAIPANRVPAHTVPPHGVPAHTVPAD